MIRTDVHRAVIQPTPSPVEPPTDGRARSKGLQDAFIELNLAAAVRQRTDPDGPDYAAAVRREREAARTIDELIDPTPPTTS